MSAVLAVAVGLLTGILSGFGIGGGSLLLLYLTLFEGAGQYQAGGINLLYFLSCAPAALISHRKNGLIEREAFKCCVPAGVVTSVLSALLAARVDTDLLRRAFRRGFTLYRRKRDLFTQKITPSSPNVKKVFSLSKEWIFLSLHPIRAVARVK